MIEWFEEWSELSGEFARSMLSLLPCCTLGSPHLIDIRHGPGTNGKESDPCMYQCIDSGVGA